MVASTNKQFGALMRVLGEPDVAADERFDQVQHRIMHREALLAILDRLSARRTAAEWLEALDVAEVPASPVNDMSMVFDNPQVQHRAMLSHATHPVAGDLPILRNPIRKSATPIGEATAPPTLGQDNDAVLRDVLGYDAAKIAALHEAAVL